MFFAETSPFSKPKQKSKPDAFPGGAATKRDPDRPDRLQNEKPAYSTRFRYFHAPTAKWRFSESLKSPVTMQLSADPRIPPTVNEE